MFALLGIGLIVDTTGTSETRVPNFFLGRPTGALGATFGAFFFGGINVLFFAHIHKRKKNCELIALF